MKRLLFVLGLTLAPFGVMADDSLVRFDGGIGVDPVAGIASNVPAPNLVRGIPLIDVREHVHVGPRRSVVGLCLALGRGVHGPTWPGRAETGPSVFFHSNRSAIWSPSRKLPPGKRRNFGFMSTIICMMSARKPFG